MLEDVRRMADRLKDAAGNDALALFHLSLIYHRLGQDPLAMHLAKRANVMWMGPRPRELYQVLYPGRYLHSIRTEAGNNGLDPALVLAVMRQESRFVANARSRAGARGLMQIMPKTGRRLMGAKKFRADTLYHPGTSIHYGTKFLAKLLEQYQGSLVRALGAYNAGPRRMNSWLKSSRCRQDDDFLVEDINIAETREYIKRVLEGYYIYSWLLGEGRSHENSAQGVP
jgi:soluble lytic murein transglycosylase